MGVLITDAFVFFFFICVFFVGASGWSGDKRIVATSGLSIAVLYVSLTTLLCLWQTASFVGSVAKHTPMRVVIGDDGVGRHKK